MSTLLEQVDGDLKDAMKAKDSIKVSALRMLKSAQKNAAIDKRKDHLDESELLALIGKLIKQRQDSIAEFKRGNRPDLVEREEAEIRVLSAYLPSALSDAELESLINEAIREVGASKRADMGKVMKIVLAKAAGRADGGLVSQKVSAKLL